MRLDSGPPLCQAPVGSYLILLSRYIGKKHILFSGSQPWMHIRTPGELFRNTDAQLPRPRPASARALQMELKANSSSNVQSQMRSPGPA